MSVSRRASTNGESTTASHRLISSPRVREFSGEDQITVVTAGWTNCPAGASIDRERLVQCRQGRNVDESLCEIILDELCGLVTEDRETIAERMDGLARQSVVE